MTTASTTAAAASTVSSHCHSMTIRHQAGGLGLRAAATPRTASASAPGTIGALLRAASRRLPAHGTGSAPPTESANAVIALSTSDCCAWPTASAARPARRPGERLGQLPGGRRGDAGAQVDGVALGLLRGGVLPRRPARGGLGELGL